MTKQRPAPRVQAKGGQRDDSADGEPLEPTRESCPFCEPNPDWVWLESRLSIAMWDAYPSALGHTLIVPRRHLESVFDATPEEYQDMCFLIARARRALKRRFVTDGFTVGCNDGKAAGQTIAHGHMHLIPRKEGDVHDPRGGIRQVLPKTAAYWLRKQER